MVIQTTDNKYGVAKWIVDPVLGRGTHITIASAITSASSGDTIFIRPGTFTENLTIKAGVNLSAFECDSFTPNVTIIGTCTFTTAGTTTISGIRLQTNSAVAIAITGSAASILNLLGCYLNCTNNTGITLSSSSSSAGISFYRCNGDLGTTGIAYFAASGGGSIGLVYSLFGNSGASTTANTISAGLFIALHSEFDSPITSSGTAALSIKWCTVSTGNTKSIIAGGSGTQTIEFCDIYSGTATAITCTTTINSLLHCFISSSNTNAIDGAGTLNYQGNTGIGKFSTTTQIGGTLPGGLTQAPSAGFLGEQISSFAATVSLTSTTTANITSIALTPGIWDVSCLGTAVWTGNGTTLQVGISATSATITGNAGDDYGNFVGTVVNTNQITITVPQKRVIVTVNTNYYLVSQAVFSTNACTASGRISATRVG